jgi:hypothetical protein
MNIERWPRWIRWLLFVPVAGLAMVVMHFALTLAFSGNEEQASVFGIAIEGSGARWINTMWREGLMRFLEPWALVAAAGVIAPARKVPSIAVAGGMSLLLVALLGIQLSRGGPSLQPTVVMLRAFIGVAGAIAGAMTAIRSKAETAQVPV